MRSSVKNGLGLAVTLLIAATSMWLVTHQQEVVDWWRLQGYEPSEDVAKLADDAGMSDEGRRVFYIQDPQLLGRSEFTGKCNFDEVTIVLGCYVENDKIYVFNVNENRLNGIEEVTAAHEMLHAVYSRLSDSEKSKLDAMLLAAFADIDNARLESTVESYRKRDPTIIANELHSILGTEIRVLPAELETHYAKYFVNRAEVVALAEAYEKEFTALEAKIAGFDSQIETLGKQIEAEQNNVAQLGQALNVERQQLEAKRSNPEEYNAAVPAYNAQVREYNRQLEQLRTNISTYNQLVEQRNNIALEEKELIQAIDAGYQEIETN